MALYVDPFKASFESSPIDDKKRELLRDQQSKPSPGARSRPANGEMDGDMQRAFKTDQAPVLLIIS